MRQREGDTATEAGARAPNAARAETGESRPVLCGAMLGACPRMLEAFALIRRAAACDAGVVLTGECGTGRALAARTIHDLRGRRLGPFVTLDAEAFEPDRLESELLGRSGTRSPGEGGALMRADGGTLLLGGLDHTTAGFQERLLAYLRTGRFHRDGGDGHVDADVRILVSSERGLEEHVEAGALRSDLFYLLAVLTIDLPPLRERGGDVLHLAFHLLRRLSGDRAGKIEGFTRDAVAAMVSHDWPGNVSEMENLIRRAVIVAGGAMITEADLGLDAPAERRERTLREALDDLAKEMVEDALRRTLGNVSRAARSIGVSRAAMYDMIRKHGVDVRRFKRQRVEGTGAGAAARGSRSGRRLVDSTQRPAGARRGSLDTPAPVDLQSGRAEAQE